MLTQVPVRTLRQSFLHRRRHLITSLHTLADKLGRRPVVIYGLIVTCITQTVLLFSTSREFSYLLIFILGLAMPMRVFVGYIYAMEFLPVKKTQLVSAVTLGNDGLMLVIASLWFMLISRKWWTLFFLATMLVYLTLALVVGMPESPKFLVSRGRYAEAREVMTKIARINGIYEFEFNEEELKGGFSQW